MWRYALLWASLLHALFLCNGQYYGKLIGTLDDRQGAPGTTVRGDVYAVDADTLQIVGFTLTTDAPDVFLWAGTTGGPSADGVIIPKARGAAGNLKLENYDNAILIVHLDEITNGPTTISGYRWISVWCRSVGVNFAHVTINDGFTPPGEFSLGRLGLSPPVHQTTADNVVIVDTKTIRFEGLTYDGRGPGAYFWYDIISPPTASGIRVPRVGESSAAVLPGYSQDEVTISLPGDTTVFDIRNIGIWCEIARQNFGHVVINNLQANGEIVPHVRIAQSGSFDNCEVLEEDNFQVSWSVVGPNINIRLASRQPRGNYMGFGISGSDTATDMVGSDVVVAWVDASSEQAHAVDYYLSNRGQCVRNTGEGVCPDQLSSGNDDSTVTSHTTQDVITFIEYSRPLAAVDSELDRPITPGNSQFVSWALGPINSDEIATYHSSRTMGNKQINFGRTSSTCPSFSTVTVGGVAPFRIPAIDASYDRTFRCDIGDSGGKQGYEAITNSVGWGIAWYIDGNLIPEINVKRGKTYTFKVYGGKNPDMSARYHPFYITNSNIGGYFQLSEAERVGHNILAGPVEGPHCNYDQKPEGQEMRDANTLYNTYEDFRATLTRSPTCDNTDPGGELVWTPDENTPDVVYYQCYTHRNLGWKINVSHGCHGIQRLTVLALVASMICALLLQY